MLVTVTYLEMTSPDQRTAPPEWAEPATIVRAERPTISFYRYLYDTVGADWDWFERPAALRRGACGHHSRRRGGGVRPPRPRGAGRLRGARSAGRGRGGDCLLRPRTRLRRPGSRPVPAGLGARTRLELRSRQGMSPHLFARSPKALSVYRRAGFEVHDRRVLSVETALLSPEQDQSTGCSTVTAQP